MQKLLSYLNNISEASINANLIRNILDKVDFDDIEYEEVISGYDLKKYNKIVLQDKPLKVVLITWPPQSNTPIHQHNRYWGYLAVLKGLINESLYDYDEKNKLLSIHPSRNCKRGEILYEPLNLIHQLTNPSPIDITVSLHFFYPPNYDHEGTLLFDIDNKVIAELSKKASGISWDQPKKYYSRIEKDAFEITKLW